MNVDVNSNDATADANAVHDSNSMCFIVIFSMVLSSKAFGSITRSNRTVYCIDYLIGVAAETSNWWSSDDVVVNEGCWCWCTAQSTKDTTSNPKKE